MKWMLRLQAAIFSVCAVLALAAAPAYPAHPPRLPKLFIVYDDFRHDDAVQSAAGFSCAVRGSDKTVLFDTGGDGGVLLANLKRLGVSPQEIDAVVVSHLHQDHTGGLLPLLRRNPRMLTYLPASSSAPLLREVEKLGGRGVRVDRPVQIAAEMYLPGGFGGSLPEQGLVVRTPRGLVLVTGCAHPGIVAVAQEAKRRYGGEILLVLGGFHLLHSSKKEIGEVIAGMKKLGVRHVAPCHCSGRMARELFRKAYGTGYVEAGAGAVIDLERLR